MECCICYEKFIYSSSQDEFENLFKKFKKGKGRKKAEIMMKFKGLLITPKRYGYIKCETTNCDATICGDCWFKYISINNFETMTDPQQCPCCRQIYWKYYMSELVISELMSKFMDKIDFDKYMFEKVREYHTLY